MGTTVICFSLRPKFGTKNLKWVVFFVQKRLTYAASQVANSANVFEGERFRIQNLPCCCFFVGPPGPCCHSEDACLKCGLSSFTHPGTGQSRDSERMLCLEMLIGLGQFG